MPKVRVIVAQSLTLAALGNIAHARLAFLANTVQITALVVPGRPTKNVSLRGAFATEKCYPREGLSVLFNSRPDNCYETVGGVKHYSLRWFHGVPVELTHEDPWHIYPTAQLEALLAQFVKVLTHNQCAISAYNPLLVRGVLPRGIGQLPKVELRSKVNKKAASRRRSQRPPNKTAATTVGIVYFIQDTVTLAIKIGFCLRKPENRLAALQTGNANALRLLGHLVGTVLHEKHLHTRFAQFRIQGEWFSSGVLGHVEGILKHRSVEEWLQAHEGVLHLQDAQMVAAGAG